MENAAGERRRSDMQGVGLKDFDWIAEAWSLTGREAAALEDMTEASGKRATKPGFSGELSPDQILRFSALAGLYKSLEIYFNPPLSGQFIKLANSGPEFDDQRPVDAMIHGGLPKIMSTRTYVDALRGGL